MQAKINQQAINAFFEAFGTSTSKEYSSTILDMIVMLSENENLGKAFREDAISKLKDMNKLILQLSAFDDVAAPKIEIDFHKN